VRFVCVAGLIGMFINGFGLIGAVGVTLLAMTVTKLLGFVRIVRLMHLGVRDALPWARLTVTVARAGAAALPVLWLQRSVEMHPLLTFAAGAVLYGGVYALLSFWTDIVARLAPTKQGEPSCVA
jgi:hypothetical protein